MKKRVLAALLALVMLFGALPMSVFAVDLETGDEFSDTYEEPTAPTEPDDNDLKDTQQPHLYFVRHITNFIQKDCATVCQLKFTGATFFFCPGKSAGIVAEQLTFNQIFRNRTTVDGNERTV